MAENEGFVWQVEIKPDAKILTGRLSSSKKGIRYLPPSTYHAAPLLEQSAEHHSSATTVSYLHFPLCLLPAKIIFTKPEIVLL